MALPATGPISMLQVRTELQQSGTISLNDPTVRSLAQVASGQISMQNLRGKSAAMQLTIAAQDAYRGFSEEMFAIPAYGELQPRTMNGLTITVLNVMNGLAYVNVDLPIGAEIRIGGVWYTVSMGESKSPFNRVNNSTASNYIWNRVGQTIPIEVR